MDVDVIIKQIFQGQEMTSKSGKSYRRGGLITETANDQYPKTICFQVWGKACDKLVGLNVGDKVNIAFEIESREYNGKYYTDVKAYAIATIAGGQMQQAQPVQYQQVPPQPVAVATQPLPRVQQVATPSQDTDALPF